MCYMLLFELTAMCVRPLLPPRSHLLAQLPGFVARAPPPLLLNLKCQMHNENVSRLQIELANICHPFQQTSLHVLAAENEDKIKTTHL